MEPYRRFAHLYDLFMADAPYLKWAGYIDETLQKNLHQPRLVLDLACGTGGMTLPMAKMGYDMIGVDVSSDMLAMAQNKAAKAGISVLWLNQDMRDLNLYGSVDAVLCVCDGLNYLPDEGALLSVFERVACFINPGGILIFDINTEYKFMNVLSNNTFTDNTGGFSYVWKNEYNRETKQNTYHVRFKVNNRNRFDSGYFEETHIQYAYNTENIASLLNRAGFFVITVNEAYTYAPVKQDSERVSFVAAYTLPFTNTSGLGCGMRSLQPDGRY